MKKIRKPDAKAGTLGICFGVTGLLMVLFYPHNSGQSAGSRYYLAGFSIWLIAWGFGQIAAARKMERQESKDEQETEYQPQDERLDKLEKSGSMHNVLVLLVWICIFIVAVVAVCIGYEFLSRR